MATHSEESALPLFGWNKKPDETKPAADAAAQATPPGDKKPEPAPATRFSPEKAKRWFEHAHTAHETTRYEYAMQCWLSGLKLDPTSMAGFEGFLRSANTFFADEANVKKGLDRELTREFSSAKDDVERFVVALFQWGSKLSDPANAVRAAEAAVKIGLIEQSIKISDAAMGLVARGRPRKDLYLRLIEVFSKANNFEKAVRATDAALKLDPSDAQLQNQLRNLSAQAAMNTGGFDATGQAGGFRANIRDAEKQRQLDEGERIVKTEETIDRLVAQARDAYEKNPDDMPLVGVYITRLRERGRPEDEALAMKVARTAHEKTREFRFRQMEGEIKLRIARRKLGEYLAAAENNPGDAVAQDNARKAQNSFVKMEIEEYRARSAAYPTDLSIRFDLGKRLFQTGQFDEAIAMLQEARNDSKLRVNATNFIAQAFLKQGYVDDAITLFREALEAKEFLGDTELDLRYGLLTALQAKAETEKDAAAADEADRVAGAIMIKQFAYRDVKARRDAVKKLIQALRSPPAAGA